MFAVSIVIVLDPESGGRSYCGSGGGSVKATLWEFGTGLDGPVGVAGKDTCGLVAAVVGALVEAVDSAPEDKVPAEVELVELGSGVALGSVVVVEGASGMEGMLVGACAGLSTG